MLPFLKRKEAKAQGGVIVQSRDNSQPKASEPSLAHEACALDLMHAIKNNDVKGVARALYDVFTILESEPHAEGPHTYEAQNRLAGEE